MNKVLKVHPNDNIIVALQDFEVGQEVVLEDASYQLKEAIPVKHKFSATDLQIGAPTIKFSSNTLLFERMSDLIDIDAGTIVTGENSVESKGEELLNLIIQIASGERLTKAEMLGQDDFIPWKRGISL